MLVNNVDVENGQANGTRVRLLSVTLKPGEEPFELKLECGTRVRAMYASQVMCLTVKHEAQDIVPQVFQVESQKLLFKAKLKIGSEQYVTGMEGTQFPCVSNGCTTGHKLQGCTCIQMLVNDWFSGSNWPYVVLSRVRTMGGLYIREELDSDLSQYEMPSSMKTMLQKFRDTIALNELTVDDYTDMLRRTSYNET